MLRSAFITSLSVAVSFVSGIAFLLVLVQNGTIIIPVHHVNGTWVEESYNPGTMPNPPTTAEIQQAPQDSGCLQDEKARELLGERTWRLVGANRHGHEMQVFVMRVVENPAPNTAYAAHCVRLPTDIAVPGLVKVVAGRLVPAD